jgi:hypothetical protein
MANMPKYETVIRPERPFAVPLPEVPSHILKSKPHIYPNG